MYTFIVGMGFFWFVVLFCDTIFKTCMFHPYFKFLQISGLDVKPLMIHMRITSYNRLINQMGRWQPLHLQRWFDIGAFITCIFVFPSIILYIVSIYQMFKSSSKEDIDNSLLVPVIPGYNFPLSHCVYYIIIILLCSAIHEFGHALAASRERIGIDDWGFSLCAVVPLAFVNVRFDQFKQISLWQQLRILCAGIWHNIILSLLALILWCCIFPILSPVFYTGNGVSVLEIQQQSGLNHPAGLNVGDHIYSISDCSIPDFETWKKCLKKLSESPCQGFCIPENLKFEGTYAKSPEACINSSEYISFRATEFQNHKDICLQARHVAQNYDVCDQSSDCENAFICIFPVLESEFHRFVAINRRHKLPVLYEGSMSELAADVTVSNFVSKFKHLPASFAECIVTFLEYIIMFSSGLAVLNMLPVFFLDGQYITENLIHLCLERYIPRFSQRRYIFLFINRISMGLLISLIISAAYKFHKFS